MNVEKKNIREIFFIKFDKKFKNKGIKEKKKKKKQGLGLIWPKNNTACSRVQSMN